MTHERLARHVQLAKPMGKRPRGHPRLRWSDYVSDLAWSLLGVELAELSEIAFDRKVLQVLGLLSPRMAVHYREIVPLPDGI